MFFEQGMRGGVNYINKRFSEASKNKHILYLDMSNLYGHAMSHIYHMLTLSGLKMLIKSNKN